MRRDLPEAVLRGPRWLALPHGRLNGHTRAPPMELIGRAKRVDQIHQFESANNAANKLMRTFAVQLETLARLRRGGEQKVTR